MIYSFEVLKEIADEEEAMREIMKLNIVVLSIASLVILICVPYAVHAADVEVNGSLQLNGQGNELIFPDSSTQGGTMPVKFIIALVGIYPSASSGGAYTEQILGEIRMFAGNFAPSGWAFCNGQLLSISQNTALFSLLGITYGGNGSTNFALPNLNNRAPVGY